MKKILVAIVLCAVSMVAVARPKIQRMGNISISKAYNGCFAGTHRSDTLYTFIIMSASGKPNEVVGIRLSADAIESIALLGGTIALHHEGDTIQIQNVRLLCHPGYVYQVVGIGPDGKEPEVGEYWFTIKNLKREIKVINKNRIK